MVPWDQIQSGLKAHVMAESILKGGYREKMFVVKISFPPPGKIQKFHFLAKTLPPQPEKNFVSPPRQIIPEIFIPPQKFGVKWHYGKCKANVSDLLVFVEGYVY